MQCRLSTVVLLTIILVLGSYLAFQNLKSQTVTIENCVDYWKVPDSRRTRTKTGQGNASF